jgi:methylmalonyl-CoA carboxyltransferase 12S subunit
VKGLEDAMRTETVELAQLAEALAALRQELARLGERVAALEAALPIADSSSNPPSAIRHPPSEEGLSEELVLVISAAVAAFLGKKPHIRQIRLLGTTAWAQQGRVTIQASHALSIRHTRSQP